MRVADDITSREWSRIYNTWFQVYFNTKEYDKALGYGQFSVYYLINHIYEQHCK